MSEYGKGYILKSALLDAVEWNNDTEKWVIRDDDLQSLMAQKNDVLDVTHGHWLFCGEDHHGCGLWKCSRCGNVTGENYAQKHCPFCGSIMS